MKIVRASLATMTLGFISLQAGAGNTKHVREEVDPYSGLKTVSVNIDTHPCMTQTTSDPNPSHVRLVVSAIESKGGVVDYALIVDMTGGHWIHPGKHGFMETIADGTHDVLYPVAEKSKWNERSAFTGERHIRETIPFGIDRNFITSLSSAKAFQFRVIAADTTLERCTDAKHMRDLQEFLGISATL
jgi:hypothetical protein